jgi:cyanophycinase
MLIVSSPQTKPTVLPQRPLSSPISTVIIGGAEDKEKDKAILSTVLRAAGGKSARMLIIPTASGEPELLGEIYRAIFTQMGAQRVEVLNLSSRPQADLPDMAALLQQMTAVFLTGGDQVRLVTILAHTRFGQALKNLWQEGHLVIAGTSAGASALGSCMIAWGTSGEAPHRGILQLSTGLGLLPGLIIDQHFFNRNRLARLITAVASNPTCLGIGIDENTAVTLSHDGRLTVLGEGSVTLVDGRQLSFNNLPRVDEDSPLSVYDLKLHILVSGGSYHLTKQTIEPN